MRRSSCDAVAADEMAAQMAPARLSYGQPRPRGRRWVIHRVLAALSIAVAIIAARRRPTLDAWAHSRFQEWRYRRAVEGARAFRLPRNEMVYNQTLAGTPEQGDDWWAYKMPWGLDVYPVNRCSLFLHERTSPAGHVHLVGVGIDPSGGAPSTRPRGVVWYRFPGDRCPTLRYAYELGTVAPRPGRIKIFAGQPDPSDPSHFTISYELDGKPKTIDGWLNDDDTVRFNRR